MDSKVVQIGWDFIIEISIFCSIPLDQLRNMTLRGVFRLQEVGRQKLEMDLQMKAQSAVGGLLGGG